MKQITSEWIAKAEADFATAQRELDATDNPNYDFEKCQNVRATIRQTLHL